MGRRFAQINADQSGKKSRVCLLICVHPVNLRPDQGTQARRRYTASSYAIIAPNRCPDRIRRYIRSPISNSPIHHSPINHSPPSPTPPPPAPPSAPPARPTSSSAPLPRPMAYGICATNAGLPGQLTRMLFRRILQTSLLLVE